MTGNFRNTRVKLIVSLFASRRDNVGLHYSFVTYVSIQGDTQNNHIPIVKKQILIEIKRIRTMEGSFIT